MTGVPAFLLAAVTAVAAGMPAAALQVSPNTQANLKHIEAERDAARSRLKQLESGVRAVTRELIEIDEDLAGAARKSRVLEKSASAADARLRTLNTRSDTLHMQLRSDEDTVRELLAALMVWGARRPPPLVTPARHVGDQVRAAILMGHAAPALNRRAHELAGRIADLSRMRAEIDTEKERLAAAELILAARREHIGALAAEKRAVAENLSRKTSAARATQKNLTHQARSLRELLDQLASRAPSPPSKRPDPPVIDTRKKQPVSPAQPQIRTKKNAGAPSAALGEKQRAAAPVPGRRTAPAQGKLVGIFGEQIASGGKRRGLTYATRKNAQILAPQSGLVEYAGHFRSYGNIVILNVGKGYLVVLAGMEKVYTREGQSVFAGEPVGQMAAQADPAPQLYFEVRRDGRPVDPRRWISQEA